MNMNLISKLLVLIAVLGLAACGGSSKKHTNSSSSSLASSSVAVSNVMEIGKEYPFTANTKIINTGTKDLVVTQKYYWETKETKVVLKEGSATID